MGGIGVGLNGWWTTEEVEYGLTDSGSRYLVVDERLYPRVAAVRERWIAAVPMGRIARAEEVADVIVFLASPRASYVSGAVLQVDGAATRCV